MGAIKSKTLKEPFCDPDLKFNIAQVKQLHQQWSRANIGFVVTRDQLAEFLGDAAKSSRIYDALLQPEETSLNVMKLMAAMCMFSEENSWGEKLAAMFQIFDLRKEKKVYFEEWAIAMILCAQAFIRVTGVNGIVDEASLDKMAAGAFASVGISNADESSFMDQPKFEAWASSVASLESDGYLTSLMKKVIVIKDGKEPKVEEAPAPAPAPAPPSAPAPSAEEAPAEAGSDSDSYSDEDDFDGEMVAFEDLPPPKPRGRKVSVSASSAKVELNVPLKKVEKTQEDQDSITEMLKQSTIFSHLPAGSQTQLKDAMSKEGFKAGDDIIKQGDIGDKLFLLKSGEVKVYVEAAGPDPVKTYAPGEAFGELALLYNAPRAATCKAMQPSEVWALDQTTFRSVMQSSTTDQREKIRAFVQQVPMLATLTEYEQLTIADSLSQEEHPDGAVIVNEGDAGDAFYIVEDGTAVCTQIPKASSTDLAAASLEAVEVGKLQSGAYFGEIALLTSKPRQATVTASGGPLKLLKMRRKDFTRVLGPLVDIMNRNIGSYQKAQAGPSTRKRKQSVTLVAPELVAELKEAVPPA